MSLETHRKSLPSRDPQHLYFSVGETALNTAKFALRGSGEFRSLTDGVTGQGIPWFVRVVAKFFVKKFMEAPTADLRRIAGLAHRFADVLEGAIAHETIDQTE